MRLTIARYISNLVADFAKGRTTELFCVRSVAKLLIIGGGARIYGGLIYLSKGKFDTDRLLELVYFDIKSTVLSLIATVFEDVANKRKVLSYSWKNLRKILIKFQ